MIFVECHIFFFFFFFNDTATTEIYTRKIVAASDVYKRQEGNIFPKKLDESILGILFAMCVLLSLIHISEPTRLLSISYAVFCSTRHLSISYAVFYLKKKMRISYTILYLKKKK